MIVKNPDQLLIMQEANQIVAETLAALQRMIEPGVTTWELDKIAEDACNKKKAIPAFKGYRGFPASLCVSLNEQVVHGIPSKKCKLKKGDILSIDFGVEFKGFLVTLLLLCRLGRLIKRRRAFWMSLESL